MSVALITVFDYVGPPLPIPAANPYSVPPGCKTAVADTAANVIAAMGGARAIAGVCTVEDAADDPYATYVGRAVKDLQGSSVETADVQALSITAAKLAANAVTTAKVADGAVTIAKLDLASTTTAPVMTKMTGTQRDAIAAPVAGMLIYNTTTNKLNFRAAAAWEAVTSS